MRKRILITPRNVDVEKLVLRLRQINEVSDVKIHDPSPCPRCKKYPKDILMLKDFLWDRICDSLNVPSTSCLCIDCMEKGLGRAIIMDDLKECGQTRFIRKVREFK